MADPRQRNAYLIIFGLMICALLVLLILDFGRIFFSFKRCPKRPRKEVTECWACWGMENCKAPFRQICTEETAEDTRNKMLQYWEEETDPNRLGRDKKTHPRDHTGKYIIFNRNVFQCLSVRADYHHRTTKERVIQMEAKGCVYKEFNNRHMYSTDYNNEHRDALLYERDDPTAFKRYICSADLCNDVWDINDIGRPRTRRFFEGPILPLESNPRRILYVDDD